MVGLQHAKGEQDGGFWNVARQGILHTRRVCMRSTCHVTAWGRVSPIRLLKLSFLRVFATTQTLLIHSHKVIGPFLDGPANSDQHMKHFQSHWYICCVAAWYEKVQKDLDI